MTSTRTKLKMANEKGRKQKLFLVIKCNIIQLKDQKAEIRSKFIIIYKFVINKSILHV
jgi:hypothetical protein